MLEFEKLWKSAKIEADWIRYYGHKETRLSDKFIDAEFYDRIKSIGYTKKTIPLHQRCSMLNITSDKPVLDSSFSELKEIDVYRNHENNVYTALEYFIARGVGTGQLVEIIKGIK